MNKDEMTMIGFEIVAYAGEARSHYMMALKYAKNGEFEKAEEEIELADKSIVKAHHSQTDLLAKEAQGVDMPFSVTFIHGQDHLMTTMVIKDLINTIIELYKRGI